MSNSFLPTASTSGTPQTPPRPIRPLPTRTTPPPATTTNQQSSGAQPLQNKILPFVKPEAKLKSLQELLAAYRNRRAHLPYSVPKHPRVYTIQKPSSARPLAGTPPKPALGAQGFLRQKNKQRRNKLQRSRTIKPQAGSNMLFPSTSNSNKPSSPPESPSTNPLPTYPGPSTAKRKR